MKVLYTIEQVSFYLEIVKVRFQNDQYIKAIINYYSKPSRKLFKTEKNVKILRATIKRWEKIYD